MEKQRGITITNIDRQSNELYKLLGTGWVSIEETQPKPRRG